MAVKFEPLVIKNRIHSWPSAKWTPKILSKILLKKAFEVRFGSKKHKRGSILFETESPRVFMSFDDFILWEKGEKLVENFERDQYWAYIDYKYMFETVQNDHLNDVDWTVFGIDANGIDSSIWIGTAGAYTPCHYDTYGFNLHAQLFGSKRWVLFPPNDDLKPTRIPYEQSSVFSSLDILSCPWEFAGTNPHIVTLHPGDVLYIPPNWWHSVQCLELSISINTWVVLPEFDAKMRKPEICTRLLFAMLNEKNFLQNSALCPSEKTGINSAETLDILNDQFVDKKTNIEQKAVNKSDEKRRKIERVHEEFLEKFSSFGERLHLANYEELKEEMDKNPLILVEPDFAKTSAENAKKHISLYNFLQCLLHPNVMETLASVIDRL